MTILRVIPDLDPATYQRHALHSEGQSWVEKNCYIDLWIELLHALRLEPLAMLPFTATIDFEGDQWTFFKPSHDELRELYGIDVQELTVWRPLLEHVLEHTAAGRMISTESDAFWLPDTAGTDYRRQHTKTTIVINEIDLAAQRLSYFHNAGYYRLEGEDFVKTFRLDAAPDPAFMPLFAEFVRCDRKTTRSEKDLAHLSVTLWRKHLERVPASNPVARFAARFDADLAGMQERGLAYYHAWAFASTRQLGAAFELAAANAAWLARNGYPAFDAAIPAFRQIADGAKAFILKAARVVNSRKPFDSSATFAPLIEAWSEGQRALRRCIER